MKFKKLVSGGDVAYTEKYQVFIAFLILIRTLYKFEKGKFQ